MSGSHLSIPRNETVISKTECSVSQFQHCERFIYFQDRSAYSAAAKDVDRSWEYINGSQIHECGNWAWGRAIPRKGIHKRDFLCSVVQSISGWIFMSIANLVCWRIKGLYSVVVYLQHTKTSARSTITPQFYFFTIIPRYDMLTILPHAYNCVL
jgi:hypothetical protein